MDVCLSGRYVIAACVLLCCMIPTSSSLDLEGLLQRLEADSADDTIDVPVYDNWLSSLTVAKPRTNSYETSPRFITPKRGWDVIEKIWQPPFPKRAWEFVDRVWKIPKFRKKYLRYLQPTTKRSREIAVNVPVQYHTHTLEPAIESRGDVYRDNEEMNDIDEEHGDDLEENGWLTLVKELICSCCSKFPSGRCCDKCKLFMVRKK